METRQQTAEWKEIHNELLKQPFCHIRQRLVRIIICLEYKKNCRWEGLCFPCLMQRIKHKPLYTPPIGNTPLVKLCSENFDWHIVYNKLVRAWLSSICEPPSTQKIRK